jgi:predicted ATP-grasp superfamily ATP-dependent carboligase
VCAGLSVRWLTQALAAQGVRVHALDCFGDEDTRAAAVSWAALGAPGTGITVTEAGALAVRLPPDLPLCYTAGFEGVPEALGTLARARPLAGNPPALLGAISLPARWRESLAACGLYGPTIRLPGEPLPTAVAGVPGGAAGAWLVKRAGTSGGGHIRRFRPDVPLGQGEYLQRFEPGPSFGVVFHADGETARLIGLVRHARLQGRLCGPFAQGAALALPGIPPALRSVLQTQLTGLVRRLGLRGVNGSDFILRRDGLPAWLELNARLPGTLPLVDPAGDWLRVHLGAAAAGAAGGGEPGRAAPDPTGCDPPAQPAGRWRAQSVVYAPRALVIPEDMVWPPWAHDRPAAGTRIASGEPWVSIEAAAPSARAALLTLRRRLNILAALPRLRDG